MAAIFICCVSFFTFAQLEETIGNPYARQHPAMYGASDLPIDVVWEATKVDWKECPHRPVFYPLRKGYVAYGITEYRSMHTFDTSEAVFFYNRYT